MAITSQLLGTIGAGELKTSALWFSDFRRYCSDINKDWTVEQGDYLFTWQGVTNRVDAVSTITFNGVSTKVSSRSEALTAGWAILRNVTNVAARGTGSQGFNEDPIVQYVKIA
ncbi:gp41 [Corynebacterium phage P1201]|uniref:Gp41 n=1 Tax=Corynebacterium phage P1201 TaxID=384848 RepID=A7IYB2_9CAUD|nr:gp41 [Corynebacterium phage P1201]ABF57495.1 gp41 [Corynebacterium phage P1201]